MRTISQTQVLKRWDSLPYPLKEALANPTFGESVISIAHASHLDDRKTVALARLTSYVLFGFIDAEETVKELRESCDLPTPTASVIVDELRRKVFAPLRREIESAYNPVLPDETDEEVGPVSRPTLSAPSFASSRVSPPVARTSIPAPSLPLSRSVNAPFVLHEERQVGEEARKESMKSFSLPFGLFKPKQNEFAQTTRATVEVPRKGPEEKKVVHYSEYRTNLTPSVGGEFINLETFGKTSATSKIAAPLIPQTEQPSQMKESVLPIKKNESSPLPPHTTLSSSNAGSLPKVEGNTVDLR
ncbi:MAG: hypothetical protein Q8P88_01530 [Candidatus Jorgensenbacteria bacterium]|nr:hypothetical protein [Candidatus Jorgensenbacteria bacterium]